MFDIGSGWRRKRQGRLRFVGFHFRPQVLARSGDREAFLVEKLFDMQNVLDVFAAVHALSGAALYRLELGKFGFPEAQNVRRQMTETGNFTDTKIKFVGDQYVTGLHLALGRGFIAGAHQHFRNGVCRGRRKLHTRIFTTTQPREQPKFSRTTGPDSKKPLGRCFSREAGETSSARNFLALD
jgi:hypothetical protein